MTAHIRQFEQFVATDEIYCSAHASTACDPVHAHTDCRFHQMFYEAQLNKDDRPVVGIETDVGMVDLAFGYRAVGDSAYSDVSAEGPWCGRDDEATHYGARLIQVGNWRSFTIEKRYFATALIYPDTTWVLVNSDDLATVLEAGVYDHAADAAGRLRTVLK